MKTIAEIHVENLEALAAPFGSQRQFAIHLNKDPKQVNQWWGKGSARGIGPKVARELEEHFQKPVGWLDNDHSQLERLDAAIILKTIQRMRQATKAVEGEAIDVEADPELFAEMLRLSILEPQESAGVERGVWAAGRQSGGTAGTESKKKARVAEGDSAGRKRKQA
jgi:hypothetical protein